MRFFERHAWKVFAGLSVVIALFGAGDIVGGGSTFESGENVLFSSLTGTTWQDLGASDPGAANLVDYMVRSGGVQLLVLGLLSVAVSLTALRRGERWAWFAMWLWPLWVGLVVPLLLGARRFPEAGMPVPVISGSVVWVASVVTLILSYRRYLRPDRG